jgi:hypothetical protein
MLDLPTIPAADPTAIFVLAPEQSLVWVFDNRCVAAFGTRLEPLQAGSLQLGLLLEPLVQPNQLGRDARIEGRVEDGHLAVGGSDAENLL